MSKKSKKLELGLRRWFKTQSGNTSAKLETAVNKLLADAGLPARLSAQIKQDACSIGEVVISMCEWASVLEVSLETMGTERCSKFHVDYYPGRAIVTYNGAKGTEYTKDSNVDFWEMDHCSNNDHIIRNADEIESVGVGDILFMKGHGYGPGRPKPLVHRSPDAELHQDGRIVHRLVLKVDIVG